MPRRRVLRLLLPAVAVLVVLAVVAATIVVVVQIRRPLPSHDGTVTMPGLTAEVTVHRDDRGVPRIYASTAEDLFRAQGFVHAQDRFFEMDYRRHVTAGRLAELVGNQEAAIQADSVIRTFGWRLVAEQEWDLLGEDARRYLQAYADGVNGYLAGRSPGELAVEYTVLGLQVDVVDPEPWTPVDSLAWLKAMAWDLRSNYRDELERGVVFGAVRDVDRVAELFPDYPYEQHPPIVVADEAVEDEAVEATSSAVATGSGDAAPGGEPGIGWGSASLESALVAAADALAAVPTLDPTGEGTGSNSWVVAGEHTASGAPILANDPHLGISAPGVFSQIGLHCREVGSQCPFDVTGFSFSGFPGVIIGHNGELAWGLTNMGADVTDFFVERVVEDTYLRDGEFVPLETRTEVIEVNGAPPVVLTVRSTVHGPIVSDVLDQEARLAGAPVPDRPRRGGASHEVSLAWTALEPGRTAEAVFLLNTAQDADDVAEVARLFAVPAQNIVFATADGDIGYQAPGLIPLRQRITDGPVPSDGSWPRPGWDSRYDWQGWVPFEQLPAQLNPPSGVIVAANQAVTGQGVGPELGADVDAGYRSTRIWELLEEEIDAGPLDVTAMGAIQIDTWSPFASALVPRLLALSPPDGFTADGLDLLRDWDRMQTADSAAAAYLMAVWANVLALTFHDELPEAFWPGGGSRWLAVVTQLLEDPHSPWWDDRTTASVVESRDEILTQAVVQARLDLTRSLGKRTEDWQWGMLHRHAPQHPVLGGDGLPGPVRTFVNPEPVAVGGGSSIVDAMAWDAASGSFTVTAAPAMRMVVDLGAVDASTWVVATGTSGHPASRHYSDQTETWARGETYPWPFTPEAVAEDSTVLTLRPRS